MAKLKTIFLYFLIATLLIGSMPIGVLAEKGSKPTESLFEDNLILDEPGHQSNNKKKTDKNKGVKDRYDLDTIGLDPQGRPTLENIPKSLTYREFLALEYNWAGMRIDEKNRGIDKKTGEVKYAPPEVKYDVVVNIPTDGKDSKDGKKGKKGYRTEVYSMFGFGSNYKQYAKGEIEQKDVSYANTPKYFDMSLENPYLKNWVNVEAMGEIPAGSEIIMVDYSEPGMPGHKINLYNYQVMQQDPEQIEGIERDNPTVLDRFGKGNSQWWSSKQLGGSGVFNYTVSKNAEDGSRLTTAGNVADNQSLKQFSTKKGYIGIEKENWGANTNYSVATKGSAMSKVADAKIQEWSFQAYVFEVVNDEEIVGVDYAQIGPEDPETPETPENPEKPKPIPVPADEDYNFEVEVSLKTKNGDDKKNKHPDKGTDTDTGKKKPKRGEGEKPNDKTPENPDKEYEIEIETIVTDAKGKTKSENTSDEKEKPGNKSTDSNVGKPGKPKREKKTFKGSELPKDLDIKIDGQPAGSKTKVCMRNTEKNFDLEPGEKMTKEQENLKCFEIEHGKLSDIGMDSQNITVTGDGVNTEKKTFKKGSPVSVTFNAKHFKGESEVGTGKKGDPKIKIQIEVKDAKGQVIHKETQELANGLKPKGTAPLKPVSVTTNTEGFVACAKIDESATKAGQNEANSNDQACVSYGTQSETKNYSVRSVKVTPTMFHLAKGESTNKSFNIQFVVANESTEEDPLPASIQYDVYVNGKKTESSTVSVAPGTLNEVKGGRNTTAQLKEGNNEVRVVVNPQRNPQEKGGQNPYADNVSVFNLKVLRTVEGCLKDSQVKENKKNDFKSSINYKITYEYDAPKYKQVKQTIPGESYFDGWRWRRTPSRTVTRTVQDGWQKRTATAYADKQVALDEKIEQKTFFRSKATQDAAGVNINNRKNNNNKEGWLEFTNGDVNSLIKKGNGLEVKVEYQYELKTKNGKSLKDQISKSEIEAAIRRSLPKDARNPKYVEHTTKQSLKDGDFKPEMYLKAPKITQKGSANGLCIKLQDTNTKISGGEPEDSKFTSKTIYELPKTPSVSGKVSSQRKLYIDPNLVIGGKDNIGKITVTGSAIQGSSLAPTPPKKKLQAKNASTPLKVRINDDVKTQIMR